MFFKAGSKVHLGSSLDPFCRLIYGDATSLRARSACKQACIRKKKRIQMDWNLQYNHSEHETGQDIT